MLQMYDMHEIFIAKEPFGTQFQANFFSYVYRLQWAKQTGGTQDCGPETLLSAKN